MIMRVSCLFEHVYQYLCIFPSLKYIDIYMLQFNLIFFTVTLTLKTGTLNVFICTFMSTLNVL
jgi:hypothetical protein